jgi:lipopolysaccharide export system permease protein
MINLHFFPSKRIAFYMARLFLTRSAAVLVALVAILMMLDLLGNSGKILAHPANGDAELWRYVGLRVPQLIARFLPFSALLGALITLVGLNQNSEIISMKAAGISAHQIIAPLILAAALIGAITFVFSERVVTRATAAMSAWEAVEFGAVPRDSEVRANVRLIHGDDVILVQRVTGRGNAVILSGLAVYDRPQGTIVQELKAERGRRAVDGNGWELSNVVLFDYVTLRQQRVATMRWGQGITSDQFTLAQVDPNRLNFWQLRETIAALQAANRSTAPLESNLWHKFAAPFSTLLMPLLAAIAAFGLARSGQVFMRAVIGMALGFAYFVADNFALAMGNLGAYPPILAAWGPFLLFLLVGEAVLIRTEE